MLIFFHYYATPRLLVLLFRFRFSLLHDIFTIIITSAAYCCLRFVTMIITLFFFRLLMLTL